MKRAYLMYLFQCLTVPLISAQSNPMLLVNQIAAATPVATSFSATSQADQKARVRILDHYGEMPLGFEVNRGQTDAQVKFLSRTGKYTLFLTESETVLAIRSDIRRRGVASAGDTRLPRTAVPIRGGVLRMKLNKANSSATVTGMDELSTKRNYFVGNDPTKWRTNVPTFAKVKYEGIYSGIDLVYYGNQQQLEYDFVVAPGADPRQIAFDIRGATRIRRDAKGDLIFKIGEGEILWNNPVVYQVKDGMQQLVAARYLVTDSNRVRFQLAKYDPRRTLYIDPLIYSTYLGGSESDTGTSIAVDSAGNAYVTGSTSSTNFPTINPLQSAYDGDQDAFVVKLNPAGSELVYSTYLGGSDSDIGFGIAVDGAGNAYVTGNTESTDFPVTAGAFRTTYGGSADAFVTKINPMGSELVYSTYLGGSGANEGYAIAVDGSGDAYVTGVTGSTDFPVTPGAFQTTCGSGSSCGVDSADAFVTKFNAIGTALLYSTYLGGSGQDYGTGIALDETGSAYVTGFAGSSNFPVTPGAFEISGSGAFVTKFNPTGTGLTYSTYLGGYLGSSITVDGTGDAYVTGYAYGGFPTTSGAFQETNNGAHGSPNAFAAKFNSTGSALVYSTYLGGTLPAYGNGIAVDSFGNSYVVGYSYKHFPVTPGALQKTDNSYASPFVTKFNPAGSALFYSTYLGGTNEDYGLGIALDGAGNAYLTGGTCSNDFPTLNAVQPVYGGGTCGGYYSTGDAFVAKIAPLAMTTTALTSFPNPSTYGEVMTFTATVTSSAGAPPEGETISFEHGKTVLGVGTLSGGSASFTTLTLKVGTTSVKAVYGGDSNLLGSTSKPVKQVVEKDAE